MVSHRFWKTKVQSGTSSVLHNPMMKEMRVLDRQKVGKYCEY